MRAAVYLSYSNLPADADASCCCSGFGAEGDGYHSASWSGHQLIYGYAQGTN